jgi:hypothetical protein
MGKPQVLSGPSGKRAHEQPCTDAPLSAEAEADLRRLAQKWATLIKDAASFEQPLRFMLEFVGRYGGVEVERGEAKRRGCETIKP